MALVTVVGRKARQNRPALVDFLSMNPIIFRRRKAMSWSGNHFESMATVATASIWPVSMTHITIEQITSKKAAAEIPHDGFSIPKTCAGAAGLLGQKVTWDVSRKKKKQYAHPRQN
jgi:hypothetical protein